MHVRVATDVADRDWLDLRREFIPEVDRQGHAEFLQVFSASLPVLRGFIAIDERQGAIGLAEASIRAEPVNGCRPGRVVFLEGIYVQPHWRHRGCAKSLCREVERWGASEGCTEFASDVFEQDTDSIAAHQALGFEETERNVYFRKCLRTLVPPKGPDAP
jgi:aminoglycoside 6'-N-acetyltransferase I